MTRKIKFRAWDNQRKMMILFDFSDLNGPNLRVPGDGLCLRPLAEFEIMQYTGLHDRLDKEIYEGDVVRISEDRNGSSINLGFVSVVQYRGGAFVFRGVGGGWGPLVRVSGMKYAHVTEDSDGEILPLAEVVGNIYENPELLEGD